MNPRSLASSWLYRCLNTFAASSGACRKREISSAVGCGTSRTKGLEVPSSLAGLDIGAVLAAAMLLPQKNWSDFLVFSFKI